MVVKGPEGSEINSVEVSKKKDVWCRWCAKQKAWGFSPKKLLREVNLPMLEVKYSALWACKPDISRSVSQGTIWLAKYTDLLLYWEVSLPCTSECSVGPIITLLPGRQAFRGSPVIVKWNKAKSPNKKKISWCPWSQDEESWLDKLLRHSVAGMGR